MIYVDEPAIKNFKFIVGSSFRFAFRIEVNGAPFDLTGYKARLKAGVINLSTENAGIVLGGMAGTVLGLAHPTDTRGYPTGTVDHQFEIEDAAGEVTTLLVGQITGQRERA